MESAVRNIPPVRGMLSGRAAGKNSLSVRYVSWESGKRDDASVRYALGEGRVLFHPFEVCFMGKWRWKLCQGCL